MEDKAAQQERYRRVSTGERPAELANLREEPNLLEDERPPTLVGDQPTPSDAAGDINAGYPPHAGASFDRAPYHGGYDNSTSYWDGYPHHILPPVIYSNNASLFNSGYGFNPQMAYGQYTAEATPLPSLMGDRRLYLPHQNPFSPPYYPQPVSDMLSLNISSTASAPQTELMAPENNAEEGSSGNMRSSYFIRFGSFCSEELSQNSANCPGSFNLRGQRAVHGVELVPSSSNIYHSDGSSKNTNRGRASTSLSGANDWNRVTADMQKVRDKDQNSGVHSTDLPIFPPDCSRGPRASKPREQNSFGQGVSSSSEKNDTSICVVHFVSYNQPDFATDYENAMFFIIKSFNEDNVYRSIKYSVWASTAHGNRKLDAAFQKAKEMETNCPVFLYFSVNMSRHFCGVAEMVGPVNFEKDAEYWHRDRWSGSFPVKWHIIKDVPNRLFRHIILEYNENLPVTNSRDTQEVNLEQGIQMLKIFGSYVARTSIIEDFEFYEERERACMEQKARKQACSAKKSGVLESSVNQSSNKCSQAVQLDRGGTETERSGISTAHCSVEGDEVLEPEKGCSSTAGALDSPADSQEPNV